MKKITKAKSGTSLGMKSVKAGYDNNPGVTRADIISAGKMNAGKAKNGTKLAAKKPMKKAQMGTTQYMELPEANVTASRIVDKASKAAKPQKNYTKNLIKRSNSMNKNQSGFSKMIAGKKYKEGGEVEMAKKGASVKSSGMHKMPDGSMMKNSKMKSGGAVKAKSPVKKMMNGGKCKNGC